MNGIQSQTCFYSWSKEWMVYSHKHVFIADLKNEWYTVTNMTVFIADLKNEWYKVTNMFL